MNSPNSENSEKRVPADANEDFQRTLEATLPLGRGVRVVAADARGILAFEKPAGTLTHPNSAGTAAAKNALLHGDYSLKNECYACRVDGGKIRKIYILNRLDSPTSGLVLAATDEKISLAARKAFLAGTVRKIYFAVALGNVVPAHGVWENFLRRVRSRDGSLRTEACRESFRDAQFAQTHFSVVRAGTLFPENPAEAAGTPKLAGTLLKLEPHTGRTHQLRVQCALNRTPILGDKNYGNFRANARASESGVPAARNRLFLHAAETEIAFPWRGGELRFAATSALPAVFSEIFAGTASRRER